MKFEYQVQKIPVQDVERATDALNEWGKKGYEFKFATTKDSMIVVVLQKMNLKNPVGRPKKAK